jgi:GDPmannose 4,6-dehydratase
MLQQDEPGDYVVATGETHSLQAFVETAFRRLELDWRKHVVSDASLARPNELRTESGEPREGARAPRVEAKHAMRDVVRMMIEEERTGGHGDVRHHAQKCGVTAPARGL